MRIAEAASSSTAIHTSPANLPYQANVLTSMLQTEPLRTHESTMQPGGSHIVKGMGLHYLQSS